MKNLVFIVFLSVASFGFAQCELEAFEEYTQLKNLSFTQAADKMAQESFEHYKLIKGYVEFEIRLNNLSLYVARNISRNHRDMFRRDFNIPNMLPTPNFVFSCGELKWIDPLEEIMGNDAYYSDEWTRLKPQMLFYFGYDANGERRDSSPEETRAASLLRSYLDSTDEMQKMEHYFTKTVNELCPL